MAPTLLNLFGGNAGYEWANKTRVRPCTPGYSNGLAEPMEKSDSNSRTQSVVGVPPS